MGGVQMRGGIPEVFRDGAVTTDGRKHTFPFVTNWLRIKAGGDACRMYFTQADFESDSNYVELPNENEWPLELEVIWFRSTGVTAIEMVATQRR